MANSAASYLTRKNEHWPVPEGGTYVRESDGQTARLTNESDYPVVARCKICQGRIRLGHYMSWEWSHAPLGVAVRPAGETS